MVDRIASNSFTSSDGVRLNVIEAGSGHEVISFVPGWSMPASIWRAPMALLADRFTVAALDPRGQGESELAASGYDIDRRSEDIAEFLSLRRPGVLVGWSLGALEALHCLHRHGERPVRALVIVDSSVGEPPEPPPADSFREALRTDRKAALDSFMRSLFRTPKPEEEIAALCEQALRLPLEASLSLFPGHLPREHWRGIVEGFSKPLLYAVTPRFEQQANALRRERPSTRIEIFRESGHALFADEAERFARVLGGFAAAIVS